jgi:hypothetical protein
MFHIFIILIKNIVFYRQFGYNNVMRKKHTAYKKIILLFSTLFIFSCLTVSKAEYLPDKKEYKKICILYHYSKFRKGIVDELIPKFKNIGCMVTVDSAFKTNEYPPDKYDLVIIFSGIHAFNPDYFPANYIHKYKNDRNIIHVFMTFLSDKGIAVETDNPDIVDTITTASKKINKDDLIKNIFDLAIKKLGK